MGSSGTDPVFSAERPTSDDGTYHLHTKSGDFAPRCILVGSRARAREMSERFLVEARHFDNPRGLDCYTGWYRPEGRTEDRRRMSIVTTGMGGPSTAIALSEAVQSGARMFIRVGSCSALRTEAEVGHLAIVSAACRFDGASRSWAPGEFPAVCTPELVMGLKDVAYRLNIPCHVGYEATTDDFVEGQGRESELAPLTPEMRARYEWLMATPAVLCYSMEAATIAVWCAVHGRLPFAAVNAIFGNRATNAFAPGSGEYEAARVGLDALFRAPEDLIPAALR